MYPLERKLIAGFANHEVWGWANKFFIFFKIIGENTFKYLDPHNMITLGSGKTESKMVMLEAPIQSTYMYTGLRSRKMPRGNIGMSFYRLNLYFYILKPFPGFLIKDTCARMTLKYMIFFIQSLRDRKTYYIIRGSFTGSSCLITLNVTQMGFKIVSYISSSEI